MAAAAVPQERQGSRGVHQALGARELLLGEVSLHGGAWMMGSVVLVVLVVLVGGNYCSRFHMVTMVIGGWLLDVSDG